MKEGGRPTPLRHFDTRDEAIEDARSRVGDEAIVVHAPEEWLYTVEEAGKVLRFGRTAQAKPTFGSARGVIRLAEDFDEPLDDFSEYRS